MAKRKRKRRKRKRPISEPVSVREDISPEIREEGRAAEGRPRKFLFILEGRIEWAIAATILKRLILTL